MKNPAKEFTSRENYYVEGFSRNIEKKIEDLNKKSKIMNHLLYFSEENYKNIRCG